jgi:hypothetical protein
MFVPFNLSQAIDVISDTYQVEGIIRRFSVGRRKDNEEEEGIWKMESGLMKKILSIGHYHYLN